jgi:hypothetical protein
MVQVNLSENQRKRLIPGRYIVRADMPYTAPPILGGGLGGPTFRAAVGNGFLFDLHVWSGVDIEVFSPSLRYGKLSERHDDESGMVLVRRSFYPLDEGILIDVGKDKLSFEAKPKIKTIDLYGVDTKEIRALAMRLLEQFIPSDKQKYYELTESTVSLTSVRPEYKGVDFSGLEVTELGDLNSATGTAVITANLLVKYTTPIKEEYKRLKSRYSLSESKSESIPISIKVKFDSTPVD